MSKRKFKSLVLSPFFTATALAAAPVAQAQEQKPAVTAAPPAPQNTEGGADAPAQATTPVTSTPVTSSPVTPPATTGTPALPAPPARDWTQQLSPELSRYLPGQPPVSPAPPVTTQSAPPAVTVAVDPPAWASDYRYAELVMNARTGQVVYDRNGDDARHIASLTKVMTAYLVFEALDSGKLRRDQILTASPRAAGQTGSRIGLRNGQQMSVEDALHALISVSGNDAAVMLAEAIAGSEGNFAEMMTERAGDLGATRTTFRTATGLTAEGQSSSARDIAQIFLSVRRDYPGLFAEFFSPVTATVQGREQRNCRLCAVEDIDVVGQKTGYTNASNRSIIFMTDNGHDSFVIVSLGTPSWALRQNRAITIARSITYTRPQPYQPPQP